MPKRALLLVDLQYDFMPGGALAVPNGDEVVAVANQRIPLFDVVVASQDWHPPHHKSFASQHPGKKPGDVIELDGLRQNLWPDHCVQGTFGARLHADLDLQAAGEIFRKGIDANVDSYSAFFDNARRRSTGLSDWLRDAAVEELHLLGLATDYCVKFSALDAAEQGFETHVIAAGCRGIDLTPGDADRAWDEMRQAGVLVE